MVKIGFICEGKTEKTIVESQSFQAWLHEHKLDCVHDVIDAKGSGNLLPQNIELITKELVLKGAERIVILTDLDNDLCITSTKERITERENQHIIIAVRQIEAWFLSDTVTLQRLFGDTSFICEQPESIPTPFYHLKDLFYHKTGRGVGAKSILVSRMLKYGFSVENAANHPNCPSARYFLTKLQTLATANKQRS